MKAQPCLDLDFVRSQFPAFAEPSLHGQAFFENAAARTPAPRSSPCSTSTTAGSRCSRTTATRPRLRPVNGWIVLTSA